MSILLIAMYLTYFIALTFNFNIQMFTACTFQPFELSHESVVKTLWHCGCLRQ